MYHENLGYQNGNMDPWPFLKETLGGDVMIIEPDQIVDKIQGNVVRQNLPLIILSIMVITLNYYREVQEVWVLKRFKEY